MKNLSYTHFLKLIVLALMVLIWHPLDAQIRFTEGTINANLNRSGIVDEIYERPESSIEAAKYLFEEWYPGYVVFVNNDLYDQGKLRYDLANQQLEILMPGGEVKIAQLYLLKTFSFSKQADDSTHFINASKYIKYYKNNKMGIHQVLVNDKISLLKLYYRKTKPSNYVPAFDLGSKEPQVVLDEEYFLLSDDELYEISRKKDFLELFSKSSELQSFMKRERLNVKKEIDLFQIVMYINKHSIPLLK